MAITTTICRCCQRPLVFAEGVELLECSACFTVNARPQAEGASLEVLRRATEQRLRCDFHNAENSYQHVLRDFPEEHEALWGLALCRYGVEYVDDPASGRRMPVVHGVRKKPMQLDSDFQQACDLAPEAVRAQYEADAAYIDDAMAKIRDLADACPPFDVFICHKTTRPGSAEYTEDYNRAFKLYHLLDKQGYRAFFAPMEMEGVAAGSDYEAGIYHALDTAKVMLVVCSDAEYLTSAWVRNEWSRFLEMADERDGRALLPLMYGGMAATRLPREFRVRKLQAIAMGEMGSAEMVLNAVRRYAGSRRKKKKTEYAEDTSSQQPFYEVAYVQGGVSITRYAGPGGKVMIPSMIGGQRVLVISKGAFGSCKDVTEVIISEGITTLENEVFFGCRNLKEVSLPSTLMMIYNAAFNGCMGLQTINVAQGNGVYMVYEGVLFSRYGDLICCPAKLAKTEYVIPNQTRTIWDAAFGGCVGLRRVQIPKTVTSIGQFAFYSCVNLQELNIPDNVVRIGVNAFHACKALTLRVGTDSVAHRYAQQNNIRVVLDVDYEIEPFSGGCQIVRYTGSNKTVQIPAEINGQRVLRIGDKAFAECNGLTDVIIPEGVVSIGCSAFQNCPNLQMVTLPESLKSIDMYAFVQCNNLRQMSIPAGVETIGMAAFELDLSLKVHSGSAAHKYAEKFLYECKIVYPVQEKMCFGAYEIESISGGCRITQYDGVGGRVDILGVINGQSVLEIGDWAFNGLDSLTEVVIPPGVLRIGKYAFHGCGELRKVIIPDTVTTIDECAFDYCRCLQEITIPGSVKQIGNEAFSECRSLRCVTVQTGVEKIGEKVFKNCVSLKSASLSDEIRYIGENAFEGCAYLQEIRIPAGMKIIRKETFKECHHLTSVTIPEGVEYIEEKAFDCCWHLKKIELPTSLKQISPGAFQGCFDLKLPWNLKRRFKGINDYV